MLLTRETLLHTAIIFMKRSSTIHFQRNKMKLNNGIVMRMRLPRLKKMIAG